VRRAILTMQAKTTYCVAGLSAVLLVAIAASLLTHSAVVTSLALLAAFWTFILIGVRRFRGEDEPAELPRAWWRFTARPRAGFVLGILLGLAALFELAGPLIAEGDQRVNPITALMFAAPALAYLHSSLRLLDPRP
jgi:uncharacterized membrane protein YhaH (DUF805 family)